MHYVFGLYGIKQDMDLVVKFLETKAFEQKYKDKEGKEKTQLVQGALRPLQLFEYVFPESSADVVLTTLRADQMSHGQYKRSKYMASFLRKLLHLKKVPEFKKDLALPMPYPHFNNVAIFPIGVRYDKDWQTFPDGTTHEAL